MVLSFSFEWQRQWKWQMGQHQIQLTRTSSSWGSLGLATWLEVLPLGWSNWGYYRLREFSRLTGTLRAEWLLHPLELRFSSIIGRYMLGISKPNHVKTFSYILQFQQLSFYLLFHFHFFTIVYVLVVKGKKEADRFVLSFFASFCSCFVCFFLFMVALFFSPLIFRQSWSVGFFLILILSHYNFSYSPLIFHLTQWTGSWRMRCDGLCGETSNT